MTLILGDSSNDSKDLVFERESREVLVYDPDSGKETAVRFFRQLNSYDCGPCMLLNILAVKRPCTELADINVRSEVNRLREERGRSQLESDDWFANYDIQYFLEDYGFAVDEYHIPPEQHPGRKREQRRCRAAIEKQNHDLMYFMTGRHYRAVTKNGLLLDSLRDRPCWLLGDEEIENMISKAMNHQHERRWEYIGLVRCPGLEFNPHL